MSQGHRQYLEDVLLPMHNSNYGRLKSLTGQEFPLRVTTPGKTVKIKFWHVQSDPFAPGSQVEIKTDLPFAPDCVYSVEHMAPIKYNIQFPNETDDGNKKLNVCYYNAVRQEAAEDYLLRKFWQGLDEVQRYRTNPTKDSGDGEKYVYQGSITAAKPSCHILPRSAVQVNWSANNKGILYRGAEGKMDTGNDYVSFFLKIKLPGHGRQIDARGALSIIYDEALWIIEHHIHPTKAPGLLKHINANHNQEWLRAEIKKHNLVSFVANGSVLPRKKGNSEEPLAAVLGEQQVPDQVVRFSSPPSLEKEFQLPCKLEPAGEGDDGGDVVQGMGIPEGLTLIAGGGFHGKSTLLLAIQNGVYNYHPEDGRYCCVSCSDAVKIRAEDRRPVSSVDISLFLKNLPSTTGKEGRVNTRFFNTQDASGSTSQAANIIESIELGATVMLLDEDTSATNLLFRDYLMSLLIPDENEPITTLFECMGYFLNFSQYNPKANNINFIVVVGGSGQYFQLANTVIVMNNYRAEDATARAKQIIELAEKNTPYMLQKRAEASLNTRQMVPFDRDLLLRETFKSFTGTETTPAKGKGEYYRQKYGGRGSGGKASNMRIGNSNMTTITFNKDDEAIDVRYMELLREEGQLNGVSGCIAMMFDEPGAAPAAIQNRYLTNSGEFIYPRSLSFQREPLSKFAQAVDRFERQLRLSRMHANTPSNYGSGQGFVTMFRTHELGAALNRFRKLCVKL